MLNLLHPKNTIDVSVFDSWIVEGIVVWVICVVWFVSVLDVVVTIFSVVSIEFVSFLVRDVVSIALGIVVEIIVDTTSDKVWVTFTIVVCALFSFSSSSAHLIFPSLSVLPTQI